MGFSFPFPFPFFRRVRRLRYFVHTPLRRTKFMEVTSISLSSTSNAVHIIVANGINVDGTPDVHLLDLSKVAWTIDSTAVTATADATGWTFAYTGAFTPGLAPLNQNAMAVYTGANAAGGTVNGPNLAIMVVFPAVPQVTALRYFQQ